MRIAKLLAICLTAGAVGLALADDVKPAKVIDIAPAAGGLLSPDGKLVAVNVAEKYEKKQGNNIQGGQIHRVKLLDAATGKELAIIPGASVSRFSADSKVLCVQQSFDEQFAKAGQPFSILTVLPMPQLWDISNPAKPKQLFVIDSAMHEGFSPDGKKLVVSGGPEQKYGNSGKVLTGLPKVAAKGGGGLPGFPGGPGMGGGGGIGFGAGFTPRFLEIWEVDSAKFVARYEPLPKGKSGVSFPTFSPDGKLVAGIVTVDGAKKAAWKIGLYDVEKKKEARLIDIDGERLDARSHFGPGTPGERPLQFVPSHQSPGEAPSHLLAAVVIHKDAVALNLYDPATGKLATTLHKEKTDAETGTTLDYAVAPDGKTLAVAVSRRTLRRAVPMNPPAGGFGLLGGGGNINGGGVLPPPQRKQAAPAPAAPQQAQVQGGGGFGGLPGGGVPMQPFNGFGGFRMNVQPPESGQVIIYDLETRTKKHTLNVLPGPVTYATGDLLAVVVWDDKAQKLKLVDVPSGKVVGSVDDCDFADFSADGGTMLTRSGDPNGPSLKIWSMVRQ